VTVTTPALDRESGAAAPGGMMIVLTHETDEGIEVVFITDAGKEVYRTPPMLPHEAEEMAENLTAEAETLREWACNAVLRHRRLAERDDGHRCEYCRAFFAQYQCARSVYLECDCPKCMGYCECSEKTESVDGETQTHQNMRRSGVVTRSSS